MSRKDFRLLADIIANLKFPVAPETNRAIVANQFANRLAFTNPRFKKSVFLEACGLSAESSPVRMAVAEEKAA